MRFFVFAITILTFLVGHGPALAGNLLRNPGFASDLRFWPVQDDAEWSPVDSDGSGSSGSLLSDDGEFTCPTAADQSVSIVGGASYVLGADVLIPSGQSIGGTAQVIAFWYDEGSFIDFVTVTSTTSGSWEQISDTVTAPLEANRAVIALRYCKSGDGVLEAHFDDVILDGLSPDPPVVMFSASPSAISRGASALLTWSTANATSVSIAGFGSQPLNGSLTVSPSESAEYALTATGPNGGATRRVGVVVLDENRFSNSGFDTGFADWFLVDFAEWSEIDAEASPSSGSVRSTDRRPFAGCPSSLGRNFPIRSGEAYLLQGKTLIPSEQPTLGEAQIHIFWFGADGNWLELTDSLITTEEGSWQQMARSVVAPSNATSAQVLLRYCKYTEDDFTVQWDDVYLGGPGTEPLLTLTLSPRALAHTADGGTASTTYTITNNGGSATFVSTSQDGSFFTRTPKSFDLAPSESKTIAVTTTPTPEGEFQGLVTATASDVPGSVTVPIKLLSSGSVTVSDVATDARVDVSGPTDQPARGEVAFTNLGIEEMEGILGTSVAWLSPDESVLRIPPGETRSIGFSADFERRLDAAVGQGSAEGTLTLVQTDSSVGKTGTSPSVTVVHTGVGLAEQVSVPMLGDGEIALFLPGVGHVRGGTGLFLSDVSLTNLVDLESIALSMYYVPTNGEASGALRYDISSILPNVSVALADLVRGVFKQEGQTGTLQVRSKDADRLSLSGVVLNVSNPDGFYGTAIPVFRSDRAIAGGERLVIAGVRRDESFYTNIYLQEVSGKQASVTIDYFDSLGAKLGEASRTLAPFSSTQVIDAVPGGGVLALVKNSENSEGRVAAYATPVDLRTGDTWSVADWSRQYPASSPQTPIVIPIAGSLVGANDTFFRTDVSLANPGAALANGSLTFFDRDGDGVEREVTLGGGETRTLEDVVGVFFERPGEIGHLVYAPSQGSVNVTSRTFNTLGSGATNGTGVPAIPMSDSIRLGQITKLGGAKDSSLGSIQSSKPGTFRTNFGFVETAGVAARVRVTVSWVGPIQGLAAPVIKGSVDVAVSPHQTVLLNRITREAFGPERDVQFNDLDNLRINFEIVEGDGAIIPFITSTDNGTGDTIFRVE